MATTLGGKAGSVEVVCEPGVSAKWVLDISSFVGTESTADATSSRSFLPTMLEVEQLIAACIAEQGASVARMVHTFGGRDIHLRDGSRIEYRWELLVSGAADG
jgi:hypothetical protein